MSPCTSSVELSEIYFYFFFPLSFCRACSPHHSDCISERSAGKYTRANRCFIVRNKKKGKKKNKTVAMLPWKTRSTHAAWLSAVAYPRVDPPAMWPFMSHPGAHPGNGALSAIYPSGAAERASLSDRSRQGGLRALSRASAGPAPSPRDSGEPQRRPRDNSRHVDKGALSGALLVRASVTALDSRCVLRSLQIRCRPRPPLTCYRAMSAPLSRGDF